MRIEGIRLIEKRGGKSGHYRAAQGGADVAACSRSPTRSRRVLEGRAAAAAERSARATPHGRVLAADLAALRTQPPADVSAMDGYAVRAADVATAPARLQRHRRGRGRPAVRRHGRPRRGRAHLHRRRDAARRRHHGDPGGHRRDGDTVVVRRPSAARPPHPPRRARFPAPATCCCRSGRRLTARDLALAAAMNHPTRAGASRRPRSRCSRPATSWCARAPRRATARSSIPTASRCGAVARAKAPR